MTAQARYFSDCSAVLLQLQKELGSSSLQVSATDFIVSNPSSPRMNERKKARVICDYDSQDVCEMSLLAGEV